MSILSIEWSFIYASLPLRLVDLVILEEKNFTVIFIVLLPPHGKGHGPSQEKKLEYHY